MQKTVGVVKDQIMSHFRTKEYGKPEPVKIVYGSGKKLSKPKSKTLKIILCQKRKKKKKSKTIISGIWTLFETEEKKKRKEIREKNK